MKLDIANLDKNFLGSTIHPEEFEWHRITETPIVLNGLAVAQGELYSRVPLEVAETVSEGVHHLSLHTAGGRVRFHTDSKRVAVRALTRFTGSMSHMPLSGSHGVDFYKNGEFIGGVRPDNDEGGWFEGVVSMRRGESDVTVNLPLYNGICDMYIGVEPESQLTAPKAYAIEKPVVFYGSSITQGGCASRPGNSYQGHLERAFDCDYINLGFSGNAKGEKTMAEYIASLSMSAFVMDYDHNAPSAEHLAQTHEPFFQIIRAAHPDLPVIFVSKPDTGKDVANETKRRNIIRTTYQNALAAGDKHVYFVDGRKLFGRNDRDACTMDTCHPNDLGFYRMAQAIRPVLKQALLDAGYLK